MTKDIKNEQNGHSEPITEQNDTKHEQKFATVDKLWEFPVFVDTITFIGNTKYGNTAYKLTSSAVNTVSNVTKPVSVQFHNQIVKADKVAASSIEYFGHRFPIVRAPTSEVLGKVKTPAVMTITTVRQYQETFGNTIAAPTKTIFNQHVAIPSINVAKTIDARFAPVVDIFESAMGTWFPEEDSSEDSHNSSPKGDNTIQTLRAINLVDEGRQRLTKKFKHKLRHTFNNNTYDQLQESNVLLKQATETVANLNQLLQNIVLNVRGSVHSPEISFNFQTRLQDLTTLLLGDSNNKDDLQKTVQARMVDLSQALMATTDSISSYIKQNAKNFPEALQIRLHPLVNFFEKRYADVVNEIKNGEGTPTEKARNIVKLTTQQTLPLLQSSLSDFQDLMQFYKSTLETSVNNTAEKVKSMGRSSETLGVN